MAKLHVAIVGTEHCHVRGNTRLLAAREDVEVVALWGVDAAQAQPFAQPFGLEVLGCLSDVPPVDLAVVTTDTASHLPVLTALQGRAHAIHVDKPLGLNADDAVEVARLAEPYGDRFAVGFFARVSPLVRGLIERVRAGEIGAVTHIALTFGHAGRLEGWLDGWPAFNDGTRMGYGCFGDLVAHMLDIAVLMLGDITPVNCVKQTDPRFALDVGGMATATGPNGELVRFFSSARMQGPRLDIRVDGEQGSLWLRGKTLGRYNAEGLPVVLMEGDWLAASDSPAELINKLLGLPYAVPATVQDGLKVNQLLDQFEVMAKEKAVG